MNIHSINSLQKIYFHIQKNLSYIGYKKHCSIKFPKKRALISYLAHPFYLPFNFQNKRWFIQWSSALNMAQALNEIGYVVDIINFQNDKWIRKNTYNLLICHGGYNYQNISSQLNRSTKRIYYSTGLYWKEANLRERNRLHDVFKKTGVVLPDERTVISKEENAVLDADGIICLGNKDAFHSYTKYNIKKRIVCIDNLIHPLINFSLKKKNFLSGKDNFLFFSGRGNVHKGLDLLLDAFKISKKHLYICQHMQPEFINLYKSELFDSSNIHLIGHIKMRSRIFKSLINKCNWIILPSCSEGQPRSVLECMAHGMIPILPDSVNINISNFGFKLNDISSNTIYEAIHKCSERSPNQCEIMSKQSRQTILDNYSPTTFRSNFKNAVIKIINE